MSNNTDFAVGTLLYIFAGIRKSCSQALHARTVLIKYFKYISNIHWIRSNLSGDRNTVVTRIIHLSGAVKLLPSESANQPKMAFVQIIQQSGRGKIL